MTCYADMPWVVSFTTHTHTYTQEDGQENGGREREKITKSKKRMGKREKKRVRGQIATALAEENRKVISVLRGRESIRHTVCYLDCLPRSNLQTISIREKIDP